MQADTQPDPPLLTVRKLSEFLQVSDGAVRKLALAGRIPFVEISRTQLRFDLDEVLAALRKEVVER